MDTKSPRAWLTDIGVLTARPIAFVFVLPCTSWRGFVFGHGLDEHMLATLATWGMTLLIQRAEHRDAQAIHAKLDELLNADGAASNKLMNIDDKTPKRLSTSETKSGHQPGGSRR